jgi:2-polyprenyl-6-methoxyphenol hydroxylase-like FAD-dependent oxidoreductase
LIQGDYHFTLGNNGVPPDPQGRPPRDAIVIGAGIVGLATALYLQRDGHRVRVIDPSPIWSPVEIRGSIWHSTARTVSVASSRGCE